MHDMLKHTALLAMLRMLLVVMVAASVGCERTEPGSVQPAVRGTSQYVVYGEDDRREVYRYDGDSFARASQSLVALIPPGLITKLPGGGRAPSPEPVQELLQLCADEPFVDQPAVASCTGVLIDDDLVLTAGHCFGQEDRCDVYSYVFDYHYSRPGQAPDIRDLDVYGCKRLIVQERQMLPSGAIHDFAVVQLDRPVDLRRRPVPLRTGEVRTDEEITVMGSPQGLPAKIDTGGSVRPSPSLPYGYWFADTDTFGGSSGSPAYDAELQLLGFLIRGNQDYVEDPEWSCLRAKRITDDETEGHYEQFAYFAPALAALCATSEGRKHEVCDPPPPVRGEASLQCSPHPGAPHAGFTLWVTLLLCVSALGRPLRARAVRGRSSSPPTT